MTQVLHVRADTEGARPAVTPIYQCSGFEAGSPYFYSRKNNPNVAEVEEALRVLEGARHCLAVTTGMTAISRHTDVMGGFILADDDALAAELRDARFYGGANLDPHSAWLLRRSMQTLGLRMKHHAEVTSQLIGFLREQPQIARVYAPRVDG